MTIECELTNILADDFSLFDGGDSVVLKAQLPSRANPPAIPDDHDKLSRLGEWDVSCCYH